MSEQGQGNQDLEAVEAWIASGRHATALITSALSTRVDDISYAGDVISVLQGLSSCDLALTNAWLARIAAASLVMANDGDVEKAREEIARIGLALAQQSSVNTDAA